MTKVEGCLPSLLCAVVGGIGGAVVGACAGAALGVGTSGDEFVTGFAALLPLAGAALIGLAGLIVGAALPFWVRRRDRRHEGPPNP